MARKVRCPYCDILNNKENTVKISNRYYCIDCAEKKQQEMAKHKDDWDELYEYICELYNFDKLTGMMFKQIKDFRDVYGYTNKGIYLTLKYYYEVLGNEVKENTGLGIVTYFYERAKQHYIDILSVVKHLEKFEIDETPRTVTVKKNNLNNIRKIKQLPLDNIRWDEGELND